MRLAENHQINDQEEGETAEYYISISTQLLILLVSVLIVNEPWQYLISAAATYIPFSSLCIHLFFHTSFLVSLLINTTVLIIALLFLYEYKEVASLITN